MRSRQGGFTLLEVLAALSVFLIGVVGVISLLTAGTRLHQQSQNRSVVTAVIDEVLLLVEQELAERNRSVDVVDLPATEPRPVPGRPRFQYGYAVRSAGGVGPFLVELDLFWEEGGRVQTRRVEHALADLEPVLQDVLVGRSRAQ